MDSVVQNGWDQLRSFLLSLLRVTVQHPDVAYSGSPKTTSPRSRSVWVTFRMRYSPIFLIATCRLALLYYDYALTFGRECNLFWSLNSFKRWGSILFFLNRYCGVIGHTLIFAQVFVRPDSALCKHLRGYHQFLAIGMQSIVACMSPCSHYVPYIRRNPAHHQTGTFIMRTYALYDRSRVVLVGLLFTALAGFGTGIVSHGLWKYAYPFAKIKWTALVLGHRR